MLAQLKEVAAFLKNPSAEVRQQAVEIFAGLSNQEEVTNVCVELNLGNDLLVACGAADPKTAKSALNALINFAGFRKFRNHLQKCEGVCDVMLDLLMDKECNFRDRASLFLTNFTHDSEGVDSLCQKDQGRIEGLHVKRILIMFAKQPRSKAFSKLSDVICNITQTQIGQKLVLKNLKHLVDILPWAEPETCIGVLKSIKNICFNPATHQRLIDEELGLVAQLGIFICGPAEELDEEDEAKVMPAIRAKMDIEKERCSNRELRALILDLLFFFMSERPQREYMRSTGFYFVLREYDRWEEDAELKDKVDDLVQYFLRDEAPKSNSNEPNTSLPPAEQVQSFAKYTEKELTPAQPLKETEDEKEEEVCPFLDPDFNPGVVMDDLD